MITRGIHPIVGKLAGISLQKRPGVAINCAREMGFIESGDNVVIVGIERDAEDFGNNEGIYCRVILLM